MKYRFLGIFWFVYALSTIMLFAETEKYTVSGYVRDADIGETLIGANVYIELEDGGRVGVSTDLDGFYSLRLNAGKYEVHFSYVGYQTVVKKINLNKNTELHVRLKEGRELQEVVVTSERRDENIKSTDLGKVQLDMETIKSIPAFMGEVDVIKAMQMLPGVQAAGEGNSGIYVRGGGPDQNLVLLDGATIYNPGHLFGFFSVFNSDAVKEATLIKGGMPANYGGRISSVIDVETKSGNSDRFQMDGGIGLISSRFALQAPIQKGKSSFMLAGRRTYAFDVAKPLIKRTDFAGTNYNFYDLNFKANYVFSGKDRLFVSSYFGRDAFIYNNTANKTNVKIPWGNGTATVRWNHQFNEKLMMNTYFIFNDYKFSFDGKQLDFKLSVKSGVRDIGTRVTLTHTPSEKHKLLYGYDYSYHIFTPNAGSLSTGDSKFKLTEGKKYAHEMAAYIQDDWDINDRIRLSTGFRMSMFQQVGPYNHFPGGIYSGDTIRYKKGQPVKTWWGPEPRFAMRYAIDGTQSIKAGVAMNYQYIHLVSTSNSTLPTDLWVPSSALVEPQWGLQYSIGYFRNFKENMFEFSSEIYYKDLKSQIEFSEDYIRELNEEIETGYVFGKGWSYGLELFAKKSRGVWNGWLGYTLSYTMRRFDELNGGKNFPARFDRRHDISLNLSYDVHKKWKLGGTWVYATGNAFTLPIEKYLVDFMLITGYGDRNSFRMPSYHRMDLSVTYTPNKKPDKRFKSEWNMSIYNVYNRKNTYFIYYKTEGDILMGDLTTKAVSVSLFPIIPSVTWNFKF